MELAERSPPTPRLKVCIRSVLMQVVPPPGTSRNGLLASVLNGHGGSPSKVRAWPEAPTFHHSFVAAAWNAEQLKYITRKHTLLENSTRYNADFFRWTVVTNSTGPESSFQCHAFSKPWPIPFDGHQHSKESLAGGLVNLGNCVQMKRTNSQACQKRKDMPM